MQFIGKLFTLFNGGMTEILFKNAESKLIPLEDSENLPRNSMRILIYPDFIHGKGNNKQN